MVLGHRPSQIVKAVISLCSASLILPKMTCEAIENITVLLMSLKRIEFYIERVHCLLALLMSLLLSCWQESISTDYNCSF